MPLCLVEAFTCIHLYLVKHVIPISGGESVFLTFPHLGDCFCTNTFVCLNGNPKNF